MNEEAVELGKKQLQEGLTYDQLVFLFAEQTDGVVKDAMQTFKREFDAVEQSKLPKWRKNYTTSSCLHLTTGGRTVFPIHRSKNASWKKYCFIIWTLGLAMMHRDRQHGTPYKNDSLPTVK